VWCDVVFWVELCRILCAETNNKKASMLISRQFSTTDNLLSLSYHLYFPFLQVKGEQVKILTGLFGFSWLLSPSSSSAGMAATPATLPSSTLAPTRSSNRSPASSSRSRSRSRSLSGGSGSELVVEEVFFNEVKGRDAFALRVGSELIEVTPSGEEGMNESSPFHFQTVVDYGWETQYGHGRLIATHLTTKFIAYVVKGL
jgi:hypothetical protein